MDNALEYLAWRGDLSFKADGVNEVDLFLCSQLATPDYTGSVPEDGSECSIAEAGKYYFASHTMDVSNLGVIQSTGVLPMLEKLGECKRYQDVSLLEYVNKVDLQNAEQFSAVTIKLSPKILVVSFRGTDDTIIGWKEDFNLSVMSEVPAQRDAVEYLTGIAQKYEGIIYVVGHSKGGNLAVYASCMCDEKLQERIAGVYSFDGPGFDWSFLKRDGYLQMQERIFTVLSQHSAVGMILHLAGKQVIVKSSVAGARAHDGFKWYVKGPKFVKLKKMSEFSVSFHNALNETLETMTVEQRKVFIDELFDTLFASGAETLTDIKDIGVSGAMELMKGLNSDEKVGAFQNQVLRKMMRNYLQLEVKEIRKQIKKVGKNKNK